MRAAVFNFAAPNLAADCSAHMDVLDRKGAEHAEAVEFAVKMFQATKPETFVMNWIADPAADLAQLYRALVVFGDDVPRLGQAVKNIMLNRMKEAAEFTVSQGE